MSLRREFMNYVGTGAIGGIIGYYVGAKGLLGIQSEDVVRTVQDNEDQSSAESEQETFSEDFDYQSSELTEQGWDVNGDFSISDSQVSGANSNVNYMIHELPSSFLGDWTFEDVKNSVPGKGLKIRFASDPASGDLPDNVTGYTFAIQQLPDGIGRDYEGSNVALWRQGTENSQGLFDPQYDHNGETHDYRIENDDGDFRLYIDGELIGEKTDNSKLYKNISHIVIKMRENQHIGLIKQDYE